MPFAWPTHLRVETVSWGIKKAGVQFRSAYTGSVEAIEFPGQIWRVSVTLPPRQMYDAGAASAFFMRMAGGMETVLVPYWPRRSMLGTMQGSPTVASNVLRGALVIPISTAGTVKAGDAFSVNGQLLIAFDDASSVSGVCTVPLVNRVRANVAAGTAVVWSQPTMKCNMPEMTHDVNYMSMIMSGFPVNMEEVP